MSWVAACCEMPDWDWEDCEARDDRDDEGVRLRCGEGLVAVGGAK